MADGSLIFLGVIVAFLIAVIYGYFTIGGSGINKHPDDGSTAPGAAGPSEASGQGRSPGDGEGPSGAAGEFDAPGTR